VPGLCACVRTFYLGAKVELLPGIKSKKLLANTRSRAERGFGMQINTASCHALLDKLRPADSFIVLGFTCFDLYPRDDWNFVFGEALPSRGTGVFSFARYGDCDTKTFMRRCMAVLCHEVGHLFGLSHCIWWECLMNGSNHDSESDGRPMHLCPMDLAKLQEALGMDLLERERALEALWRSYGLEQPADWHRAHMQALEGTVSKGTAPGGTDMIGTESGLWCEPCPMDLD